MNLRFQPSQAKMNLTNFYGLFCHIALQLFWLWHIYIALNVPIEGKPSQSASGAWKLIKFSIFCMLFTT